jgi:hypothetical protein
MALTEDTLSEHNQALPSGSVVNPRGLGRSGSGSSSSSSSTSGWY